MVVFYQLVGQITDGRDVLPAGYHVAFDYCIGWMDRLCDGPPNECMWIVPGTYPKETD